MPNLPPTMKVRMVSSKILKPIFDGHPPPPSLTVPLSVFDKVSYNTHIAVIYAFRPPIPPNSSIELGLAKALSEYREWAGRLATDSNNNVAINLNNEGVKFIEASIDATLNNTIPFKPSPVLLTLHPPLHGVAELVQVQLTRFTCGSMVVGFTAHHLIADGHATSNFLVAWGCATRGLPIHPLPLHDRATIFTTPKDSTNIKFEHRGVEFKPMKPKNNKDDPMKDDVVVHKVHFTKDFLAKLKARASIGAIRQYSTFECVLAHLWRIVTKSRGLSNQETTQLRISVDGRPRLSPRVPNEYFGNLVLWAFPSATVEELLSQPVQRAVMRIHEAVKRVDDGYFRSFIEFASSGAVEEEGLVPTAEMSKWVLCPDLEVDSWLRFPFYDLDFGGGSPYYFAPTYFPVEGMMFLLPSFMGDGSIDAIVPLLQHHLTSFVENCYSMD